MSSPPRSALDVIIIGDSIALRAFPPHIIDIDYLSFANFMASPTEYYYKMKRYLKVAPPPKCIYLITSYNSEHKKNDGLWDFYVANNFYSFNDLIQIKKELHRSLSLPKKTLLFFKYWAYRTRLTSFNPIKEFQALFKNNNEKHEIFLKKLRKNNGLVSMPINTRTQPEKLYVKKLHSYLNNKFTPSQEYDHYLNLFFTKLKKHKIKVFFIQHPFSETFWEETQAREFYREYHPHMQGLVAQYPNVVFREQLLTLPDFFFYNGNHLNKAGSEKFYQKISEEIECK